MSDRFIGNRLVEALRENEFFKKFDIQSNIISDDEYKKILTSHGIGKGISKLIGIGWRRQIKSNIILKHGNLGFLILLEGHREWPASYTLITFVYLSSDNDIGKFSLKPKTKGLVNKKILEIQYKGKIKGDLNIKNDKKLNNDLFLLYDDKSISLYDGGVIDISKERSYEGACIVTISYLLNNDASDRSIINICNITLEIFAHVCLDFSNNIDKIEHSQKVIEIDLDNDHIHVNENKFETLPLSYSETEIEKEIKKIENMIQSIEERFMRGEVQEYNYNDLKSKYNEKILNLKIEHDKIMKAKIMKTQNMELFKKIITRALSLYDDQKYPKKEFSWNKESLQGADIVELTSEEFDKKASELQIKRNICMIFYDFEEGKIWIKEYGTHRAIYWLNCTQERTYTEQVKIEEDDSISEEMKKIEDLIQKLERRHIDSMISEDIYREIRERLEERLKLLT